MSASKSLTESDEATPLLQDEVASYQTNAGEQDAVEGANDAERAEEARPKVSRAAVVRPLVILKYGRY